MSVKELIRKMPSALNQDATANVQTVIQYRISEPMYLVIDNGQCTVHEGVAPAPDLALTMTDEHMIALITGELNGVAAFMSGKLKVEGDIMLAQRLQGFFDTSKLA
jgi:putative sterol carrier protein